MAATTTVFQGIGGSLENATQAFVVNVAADTIAMVEPWALGALSIYLALSGYKLIYGNESYSEILIKAAKVVLISALALNSATYLDSVVSAFQGIEEGLTAAFSRGAGGSIYATLDGSLGRGLELILQCDQKARAAGWMDITAAIGWYVIAAIIAIGGGLVVVFGGVAIVVATLYLKILFGIGPFFLACLMFPATAQFFERWAGHVMNNSLVVSLTAVVLTLGITIYDNELAKIAPDSGQNMLGVSLELLVVAVILYGVVRGVMPMATALAGGLTMSVFGFREAAQAGRQVGSAARGIVNPVSTRRDTETGHMVTARRGSHLLAGRTMVAPAYRQHFLESIGKNWSRPGGGRVSNGD